MASPTTVTCNAIVPELLNPHNYKHWSSRVRTYLVSKDLWDVVKGKHPTPDAEAENKAWMKKNAEALHAINISCGTEMFSLICEIDTAMEAWEVLEKEFKLPPRSEIEETERHDERDTTIDAAGQARDQAGENNANNFDRYKPFFDYVNHGDWDNAKECLLGLGSDADNALRATDPYYQSTALLVAALNGNVHIVKELVQLMTPEDLEIKSHIGATPLGALARQCKVERDAIEMAKYMVEKNDRLVWIPVTFSGKIPVVEACVWSKWELGRYLYSVTPTEALMPQNGPHGACLLCECFGRLKMLDIAWNLLQCCPTLAIGESMLTLARTRSAFLSGTRLTRWQKWIYNCIHIQAVDVNSLGISINVFNLKEDQGKTNRICSGINTVYEMKLKHLQIIKFLHWMGQAVGSQNNDIVKKSMFAAIEKGHVEFVRHMCGVNKRLLFEIYDETKGPIFHYAIECRQEKIYSLIYGLEKETRKWLGFGGTNSTKTMLFSACQLSPLSQLNHIQGASLQMQRELQWFKEVESMVPSEMHDLGDNVNNLPAGELFTINHKKLMEEAEMSMKGTATSCTVVAALVVTIMFAVAFTVPGGNNGDTGIPVFIDKKLFMVFIVSDSISLISSTTSVIIFLGILTSRYAKDDFLKSLPTKIMIGLFTLFLAIAAMMVTFSSALIIMLHGKYSWIVLMSILVASVPVSSFAWMQFPLLIETFMSTYGPGIFDRKVKPWLKI
ncbi:uncharacterized protein LOC112179809 isoform X2 [Rosa chinensis]|uniref:uncharacterized protein LOC112179809 isoform X2 n=1 Tax=Rosa chinensis TaxID=74649 RepID=UPI000D08B6FE|nr:uncharacterized protein LOC112179809 isoform X2 [Rosa chinensis]